jgi:Poly (ADP-ribose) glycohydrolase (PARG)
MIVVHDCICSYFGGGVLGTGAVQEELLLMQFPEALIGLLLFEKLQPNEAALIFGARRFSKVTGYGASVKCAGRTELSCRGGRNFGSTIISIDALHFKCNNVNEQLQKHNLDRELIKAYAGFCENPRSHPSFAIGSGKWGCGVFNVCNLMCSSDSFMTYTVTLNVQGDVQVKSLVQVLAATICERPLVLHIVDDEKFASRLEVLFDTLRSRNVFTGICNCTGFNVFLMCIING